MEKVVGAAVFVKGGQIEVAPTESRGTEATCTGTGGVKNVGPKKLVFGEVKV